MEQEFLARELLHTTILLGEKETQATIKCYYANEKTHYVTVGKRKGYIRIENKGKRTEKVTVFIPYLHPLAHEFTRGNLVRFTSGELYIVGETWYIVDFAAEVRRPISA